MSQWVDTKRNILHKLPMLLYIPFFVYLGYKGITAKDLPIMAQLIASNLPVLAGVAILVTIMYILSPTSDSKNKVERQ
jgi:putative effector of murein hydrolase LrgA (UPF0299 family)